MCIIIDLPSLSKIKKEITEDVLKFSWESNKDGSGYSYVNLKEKKIVIEKGFFKFKKFYGKFAEDREKNKDSVFIVHFRNNTYGENKTSNCHPFYLDGGNAALAHNGTIFNLTKDLYKNKGKSDSKMFVEFLNRLPSNWYYNKGYQKLIAEYLGISNKISIITLKNETLIWNKNKGFIEDDIWFSSDYYKNKRKEIITHDIKRCCMCKTENYNFSTLIEGTYRYFCTSCWKKKTDKEYWGKCISCKKTLPLTDQDKFFCDECTNKELKENINTYDNYN
jgi:predicted glutamine amidotransferase